MEKREDVVSILSKLDMDDIEEKVWEPYHTSGPGRPPRNPLGIFKALMVKKLRQIPSDRDLYRRLWNDPQLREICDIEDHEKPYHSSQLTRFRRKVGSDRLEGIVKRLAQELVEDGVMDGETVTMDATFIKAWSRRNPKDSSHGDLPVAYIAAPANENEKRHAPDLLDKTLKATKRRMRAVVADPCTQAGGSGLRPQAAG